MKSKEQTKQDQNIQDVDENLLKNFYPTQKATECQFLCGIMLLSFLFQLKIFL